MDDLLKSLHSKIVIKGPLSSSFYLRYGFHRLREKMQNRPNLEHISSSDKKKVYRTTKYYIQSLDGCRNKIRGWVSLFWYDS